MFAGYSRLAAFIATAFLLLAFSAPARAQITVGGDPGEVWPADLSTWTYATAQIGIDSGKTGTVTVAGDSNLQSQDAYVGYTAGSSGSAVVTGQGSNWGNRYTLYIGYKGTGTLTVENGGTVGCAEAYVGYTAGSSGGVVVTGQGSYWFSRETLTVGLDNSSGTLTVENGGTVTTGMLYASASDLRGDGTINTNGLVTDLDLVFDATHGTSQILSFGTGGTLNLNLSNGNSLGVGYREAGSLRIADGLKIGSNCGYLGYNAGSSGSAVVTGQGSRWGNGYYLHVGYNGDGTLRVENGGTVDDYSSYIGDYAGSHGNAVVTGAGTTWTNNSTLYVGNSGTGTLSVANGGAVSSLTAYLGYNAGSSGNAVVTGQGSNWTNSGTLYVGCSGSGTLTVKNGGTVTTGMLYASASDLRGNGTINTHGLIADSALVFDAAHGANQVLSFGTGGTLNLSPSSAGFLGAGNLGAGYCGEGSLRIVDGVKVSSASGYLGYNASSSGSAVVTGQGSSWTNSGTLYVGNAGTGSLRVEKGGMVSSSSAYLGYAGSSGSAVVTGQGSSWNSTNLTVGNFGTGKLSVENGGVVRDYNASIGCYSSGSAVVTGQGSSWTNSGALTVGGGAVTVGNGGKVAAAELSIDYADSKTNVHISGSGMIVLGTATSAGTIDNRGKVNLYADAFLAAATYSPITELQGRAITWSGTGAYNGYGGTWNSNAHTFAVSTAATAASGASSTLTTGERLRITDSATGKRIGASFGTVAAGKTFRANWIGGGSFAGIPDTQGIRGAWSFTTNFAGDQALLSFELGVGVGAGPSDLQVWRYNGTAWTSFAAPDLTYGGDGIANFSVASFGSYAITVAKRAGDANDDSAVDVIDLGVLANNYRAPAGATWAMGDFNGDGAVDVVDLGILAKNYDWAGTSAAAVPEPCCMALLALGGLGLLRRRG